MDGTLTIAVHDFAAIRRALGIAPEEDILDHLAALPAEHAAAKRAWLIDHERELAAAARPASGAPELIRELHARGCQLGVLTRNDRELALLTLETIGILDCFEPGAILGRDDAPPKPSPAGLLRLAQRWQTAPGELVMVGDYLHDLECARAAGARSILVNLPDNPWPALSSHFAQNCHSLLAELPRA